MSKKLNFKVSARTARLIGRENVSNSESALIELVKNSYDADAENCIIYFDKKNKLHILDDGHGMAESTIENCWMTIGTNNKEHEYISKLGRIKSGEKGIGRFALDRLGETCLLHTKPEQSTTGHIWIANWTDFENHQFETVEEIEADLETTSLDLKNIANDILSPESYSNRDQLRKITFKNGTFISIENLRDQWQLHDLKRLYKSLSTLIPPKEETKFDIYLFSENAPDDFGKIESTPCDDFDYKIVANINTSNKANITITRNEYDHSRNDLDALFQRKNMQSFPYDKKTFFNKTFEYDKKLNELIPGLSKEQTNILNNIGQFTFTFYFMKRSFRDPKVDKERFFYKDINSKLRTEWLKEHAGIRVFRDNFRVRPYGEPDSSSMDWLGLGPRYGANPAGVARKGQFRVREYNLSGVVDISRIDNPFLKDLSSRTGIHENDVFEIFKQLLVGLIHEFEYDRSYISSEMADLYSERNPREQTAKQAENIAKKFEQKKEDKHQSGSYEDLKKVIEHNKNLKEEKEELLNEQKILRVLASSGAMLATFGHEMHALQNIVQDRSSTLRSLIEPYLDEAQALEIPSAFNPYTYIEQTEEIDNKLLHWMKFALSGIKKDRRNKKNIILETYFNTLATLWSVFLKDRQILLNINIENDSIKFRGFEAELDALFNNLIINSVEIFSAKTKFEKREITIDINSDQDNQINIIYRDTGTGLSQDISDPNKIFDLFFSTKRDPNSGKSIGTGIGMYLVKSIIDDNGGNVKIGNTSTGFSLIINLPAIRGKQS